MSLLKILIALVALLLMASVRAETNVTIDDTDPQIVYQPPDVWSFQSNTGFTQDRWNKTTHYTSNLGATASLTFTGALYVYYVGYGVKEMPPPALVPITLQPQHGSAISVQSDSYRPEGAQAQIILFSSTRLDPTETYTITVTKTNATLDHGVNIDSFILTQPDGAGSSPAQTTVAGVTTLINTSPAVSRVVPGSTSIASDSFAQSGSIADTGSGNAPPVTGAIVGGVLGGIAVGVVVAFLIFRWWVKRNRRKGGLVGPDGLLIPQYTEETPRPAYFTAPPPYSSKRSGFSRQADVPEVTDPHSVSTLAGATSVIPPSTSLGQRPMVNGRTKMAQVQQALPYSPQIHGKSQYKGNSQLSSGASVSSPPSHVVPSSPEGSEYVGAMLPAYS